MVKKFFPLDKNYVLEQAQQLARTDLLTGLVNRVKSHYEFKINPLGLEDSFTAKIRNYHFCRDGELSVSTTNNNYDFPGDGQLSVSSKNRNHDLSGDGQLPVSTRLDGFYENLAAIYRFKFGDNQLEFLWDGTDHSLHYQKTWKETFVQWTENFCRHDLFIQAVLDLTVFLPESGPTQMIENRMNHFIEKHFEVRILIKASGLQLKVAGRL